MGAAMATDLGGTRRAAAHDAPPSPAEQVKESSDERELHS